MTKEDKSLLLKDLCGRLPYGVICNLYDVEDANKKFHLKELSNLIISAVNSGCIKPYLRPMSSMTDEERAERIALLWELEGHIDEDVTYKYQDWLNEHHFDYRGLIPKGLALEASKEMYDKKEK